MYMTLGQLRRLIREAMTDTHLSMQSFSTVRNALSSDSADREQLSTNSFKNLDDPDELPPHLRDADEQNEEPDQGPVPPDGENDPYVMMDPYNTGWSVLPSPSALGRSRGT